MFKPRLILMHQSGDIRSPKLALQPRSDHHSLCGLFCVLLLDVLDAVGLPQPNTHPQVTPQSLVAYFVLLLGVSDARAPSTLVGLSFVMTLCDVACCLMSVHPLTLVTCFCCVLLLTP